MVILATGSMVRGISLYANLALRRILVIHSNSATKKLLVSFIAKEFEITVIICLMCIREEAW